MTGRRMITCAECAEYRCAGSRGLCARCYNRRRKAQGALPPKVRTRRACSVQGCELPSDSRALCKTHYTRWRVHGDPLFVSRGAPVKSLPGEQWRGIEGHPNYEVSNQGRVRSLDHVVRNGRGQRQVPGVLLKCSPGKRGYPVVSFRAGTKVYVHMLVLTTFGGPRPAGTDTRHFNGDRTDNRLENLAWGTRAENVADMVAHGTQARLNVQECPREHRLAAPNLVSAKLRKGVRECWACQLARNTVTHARKRHGLELDFRAEADRRYAEIMAGALCA